MRFSVVIFISSSTVAPGLKTFGAQGVLGATDTLLDAEATLLEPAMRLVGALVYPTNNISIKIAEYPNNILTELGRILLVSKQKYIKIAS
jgi:hypothetical protein